MKARRTKTRRYAGGIVFGAAVATAAIVAPSAFAQAELEWTNADVPQPEEILWDDIAAVASDDIWAVGSNHNPESLIMHWNGEEWSSVDHPKGINLAGIDATATDNAWAVGATPDTQGFAVHWDGAKWAPAGDPLSSHDFSRIDDVSALADGTAWAAGVLTNSPEEATAPHDRIGTSDSSGEQQAADWEHTEFAQYWDGEEWTTHEIPAPAGADEVEITAVHATSADEVWVSGAALMPDGEYLIPQPWVAHLNDGEWQTVEVPDSGEAAGWITDIAAVDDEVVFGGHTFDDTTTPMALTWDGEKLAKTANADIDSTIIEIQPDGQGGIIMAGSVGSDDHQVSMVGYRDGEISSQNTPAFPDRSGIGGLTLAPDTGQLWAVGYELDESGIPTKAVAAHTN